MKMTNLMSGKSFKFQKEKAYFNKLLNIYESKISESVHSLSKNYMKKGSS